MAPFLNYTLREPVGVVGAIVPWNFPLQTRGVEGGAGAGVRLLGGAEALGADAAHRAEAGARSAMEAGLPEGVLNVVTGYGADRRRGAGAAHGRGQDQLHRQHAHGAAAAGKRRGESNLKRREPGAGRQVAQHHFSGLPTWRRR